MTTGAATKKIIVEEGLSDSGGTINAISFVMLREGFRDEQRMRGDDKYEERRIEIFGKSLFLKKSQEAVEQKQ